MLESRSEGGLRAVQAPEQWGPRMLLRFGVANHLSIRDFQELSFSASSSRDRRDGVIACEAAPGGSVVPAAVVYGADASGKSNLVRAMRTMRRMVLFSQTKGEPGGGASRQPFLLDAAPPGNRRVSSSISSAAACAITTDSKRPTRHSNPNDCTPFRSHTGEYFLSAKGANSISSAG